MTKQSIETRRANKQDAKYIILILQEISHYFPQDGREHEAWNDFYAQKNISPRVAIYNNQIIGFANLLVEKNIRGGVLGHIGDVAVRKDMQGKGVGKILIEDLKLIAKDLGCYKVNLSCDDSSLDFYKKLGFSNISNTATYFPDS